MASRVRVDLKRSDSMHELLYHPAFDTFSKETRSRGEDYFRRGLVELTELTQDSAAALVAGARIYLVNLGIDADESVLYSCSCPQFDKAGECKHLWATILVARVREILERTGSPPLAEAKPAVEPSSDGLMTVERTPPPPTPRTTDRKRPQRPSWEVYLDRVGSLLGRNEDTRWTRDVIGQVELIFRLQSPARTTPYMAPTVDACFRRRSASSWTPFRVIDPNRDVIDELFSAPDRRLIQFLEELDLEETWGNPHFRSRTRRLERISLEGELGRQALLELARSGKLFPADADPKTTEPLRFSESPWDLTLEFKPVIESAATSKKSGVRTTGAQKTGSPKRKPQLALTATVSREDPATGASESHPGEEVIATYPGGWILLSGEIAPLRDPHALRWLDVAESRKICVEENEIHDCIRKIFVSDPTAPLELPPGIEVAVQRDAPKPKLVVSGPKQKTRAPLNCELYFDYGDGVMLSLDDDLEAVLRDGVVVARDHEAETESIRALLRAGALHRPSDRLTGVGEFTLAAPRLPRLVRTLLGQGWSIEAEGVPYRSASEFDIQVSSGMDWLDVNGQVDFDGESLEFPRLLGAIRRGKSLIPLGDGSLGVLPEAWLRRAGRLAAFGELDDEEVRFRPNQASVLDALLEETPEVTVDENFAALRDRLRRFDRIDSLRERRSFRGKLRPYQREALGWLAFLREFRFGGCLADDMGLGKTVQVIAHLEGLRMAGGLEKPCLVVAPRSVLENWRREFAKFAPKIPVIDISGADRESRREALPPGAVLLTTYAIIRRDLRPLQEISFDTVILDEAQAIKNEKSQTSRACRRLVADHRLALSGTPIENHIGELWTLFDFLEPGLLGASTRFQELQKTLATEKDEGPSRSELTETTQSAAEGESASNPSGKADGVARLARAVRPFILRRTKSQVAPELPSRTEQVVECVLAPKQRRLYDELLDHYRGKLLTSVHLKGISRSKMQVLEALLRLRQAACHPGLLDPARETSGSAKLDLFLERLEQLRAEGHRCLVFSQFTKFLGIARREFDARGIRYEYLDGRTKDRQAKVDRFQTDEECTAFLISLKAGGVGLNLTAADYVFLLDPWWNPAIEAQAIDRAHRIGQTKPVIAFRLIAANTIEQKILQMQDSKRALAESVIHSEDGWLRTLTAEDLTELLG